MIPADPTPTEDTSDAATATGLLLLVLDVAAALQAKGSTEKATKVAIGLGYRHIDGASAYENEDEIGRAIKEKLEDGTLTREDLFYTGKLKYTCHEPKLVRVCLEKSLKDLQLDYIDLFLIHSPVHTKPEPDLQATPEEKFLNIDLRETWKAMEACKEAGLTRSIGLSNFNRRQLELILNMPGLKYKPVINEVECHIYMNQAKLQDFCRSKCIALMGYSVLGSSRDPTW
ncbi:estradiol 17 beta-dehydrogenase 5-like [Ascaphus truei]|uniref:estradiol 17 beta-dehydrogenase 5-like n=1 Tax=Ascaphus truei TaxID=8439 RepID=UPI003F5AA378